MKYIHFIMASNDSESSDLQPTDSQPTILEIIYVHKYKCGHLIPSWWQKKEEDRTTITILGIKEKYIGWPLLRPIYEKLWLDKCAEDYMKTEIIRVRKICDYITEFRKISIHYDSDAPIPKNSDSKDIY